MTPDSTFPSEYDEDGEQEEWFDPMSHLSLEEVVQQLETQRYENEKRLRQTTMFEEYLEKQREKEREIGNDPDEKPESANGNKRGINRRISKRDSNLDGEGDGGATLGATGSSSRRRSKRSQANLRSTKKAAAPLTLNSVQRSQVASDKMGLVTKATNAKLDGWDLQVRNLQAEHDEGREQWKQVDDSWYKFDKSVLHIRSHVGNKYSAERIAFVSGERCKADTVMVDHLRLRSQVTRGQIASTAEELRSQDKMEESVSQVDFDQLQIKNREYVHYLSEGNALLLVEKTRVMHSVRQHNHIIGLLGDASGVCDTLGDSIATNQRMMARLAKEQGVVDNEVAAGKRLYRANKAHLEQYRVPTVVKYVEDVQQGQRSSVQLKTWVRRVQIADAQMHVHKKAWNQITEQITAAGLGMTAP